MKKAPLLLVVLIGVLFSLPNITYADVSQPVYDTVTATSTNKAQSGGIGSFNQRLGTNLSGSMSAITVRLITTQGDISGNTYPAVGIVCWDDSAYTIINAGCSYNSGNEQHLSVLPQSAGTVSTTTAIALTFDPTKYYSISISCYSSCSGGTNGWFNIWGSSSDIYSGGGLYDKYGHAYVGLSDMYFYITGGSGASSTPLRYTPSSITWVNPTNHASTTVGSVNFTFNYITDPTFSLDRYSLNVLDITNPFATIYSASSTLSSTSGTVSVPITLTTGKLYMACATLFKADGSISPFIAPCIQFSTGANYVTALSGVVQGLGAYTGEPTCSPASNILDVGGGVNYALCVLFVPNNGALYSFQSIPSNLFAKFPLNYITQIQTEWNNYTYGTSTQMVSVAIGMHDWGLGSTTAMGNILPNWTVFSSSTVLTYMSQGQLDVFKGMMTFVTWMGFFLYVYRRITHVIPV